MTNSVFQRNFTNLLRVLGPDRVDSLLSKPALLTNGDTDIHWTWAETDPENWYVEFTPDNAPSTHLHVSLDGAARLLDDIGDRGSGKYRIRGLSDSGIPQTQWSNTVHITAE